MALEGRFFFFFLPGNFDSLWVVEDVVESSSCYPTYILCCFYVAASQNVLTRMINIFVFGKKKDVSVSLPCENSFETAFHSKIPITLTRGLHNKFPFVGIGVVLTLYLLWPVIRERY